MGHYNTFERYISKILKKSSYLHSLFKYFYQYANYLIYANKNHVSINGKSEIYSSSNNIFFGYYDHTPWSNDMKYFISHTKKNDLLFLDLFDINKNILTLKETITKQEKFNFQQGIRPIWLNEKEIIFNSIISNNLSASIYNLDTNKITNYQYPVQEISKTNSIYFSIDYCSLENLNSDYGYNIKGSKIKAPKVNGIIGFDYREEQTIFELDINRIYNKSKNKVGVDQCELNHLSSSPSNNKFIFIYRSKKNKGYSELFIYDYDKDDLKLLFSGDIVSHYCWINENDIYIYLGENLYNQGFFILNSNTGKLTSLNKKLNIHGDGHPSISPDKKWIVYDSYPDKKRLSYLKLYNLEKDEIIKIGDFFSPMNFYGYYRCDLHPRWSPDGKLISIDSSHEGVRKSYIIDVSKIII